MESWYGDFENFSKNPCLESRYRLAVCVHTIFLRGSFPPGPFCSAPGYTRSKSPGPFAPLRVRGKVNFLVFSSAFALLRCGVKVDFRVFIQVFPGGKNLIQSSSQECVFGQIGFLTFLPEQVFRPEMRVSRPENPH